MRRRSCVISKLTSLLILQLVCSHLVCDKMWFFVVIVGFACFLLGLKSACSKAARVQERAEITLGLFLVLARWPIFKCRSTSSQIHIVAIDLFGRIKS